MEFKELSKMCFETVKSKGFYDIWNNAKLKLETDFYEYFICKSRKKPEFLIDLAEMGLMHTEISEAMEEIRNGDREKAVTELAGLFIRVFSYCENQNIDLESKIISENNRNKNRPLYHNRKVI